MGGLSFEPQVLAGFLCKAFGVEGEGRDESELARLPGLEDLIARAAYPAVNAGGADIGEPADVHRIALVDA